MKTSSIDGTLRERLALVHRFRTNGSRLRWPFRLPHYPGQRISTQVDVGTGTYIGPGAWINIPSAEGRLSFGNDTAIGGDLTISAAGLIEVGNGVLMSARVALLDSLHDYDSWLAPHFRDGTPPRFSWAMTEPRPVRIGDGSWLGVGVVVLPGVTIGQGCIIGANAVVSKDVPDFSVAAGVPARVLRSTRPEAADDSVGDPARRYYEP